MRYIVFALFLTPLAAHPQTTQSAAAPLQSPAMRNPLTATCDAWRTGSVQNAYGTTTLSVDVKTDGSTANPTLVRSSGNADLDRAALSCLKIARLKPVTEHGQAIEVTREYDVRWAVDDHSYLLLTRPAGAGISPTSCREKPRPGYVPRHLVPTIVSFQIGTDGAAHEAEITQSSGSGSLDQASVDCVLSAFRYVPAMQNGRAIQVDEQVQFSWTTK